MRRNYEAIPTIIRIEVFADDVLRSSPPFLRDLGAKGVAFPAVFPCSYASASGMAFRSAGSIQSAVRFVNAPQLAA